MKNKKVIVVGGGFGGLQVARKLLKHNVEVLLIDKSDHFTFTPLLVEVATGSLQPNEVSFKFRDFFKHTKLQFIQSAVHDIDVSRRVVFLTDQSVSYDYLVLATGARNRILDLPGVHHTHRLKSVRDAVAVNKELNQKLKNRRTPFAFTIIGGGPTGINFLLSAFSLAKSINPKVKCSFRLIDAAPELLTAMSPAVRQAAYKSLQRQGVIIHHNCSVSAITATQVQTDQGQFKTDFTLLSAGVLPNSTMINNDYCDSLKNVMVDDHLHLPTNKHIYALGDIISMGRTQMPKLAQTAESQAAMVASNILASIHGQPLRTFHFRLKALLLTLGHHQVVLEIGRMVMTGWVADMARSVIYLYRFPGLRNKLTLVKALWR